MSGTTVPQLLPDADITVADWTDQAGGTTALFGALSSRTGTSYLTSQALVNTPETQIGEFDVIYYTDDTRFDDYFHAIKSSAPVRPNQIAFADVFATIHDLGINYRLARLDDPFCAPSRMSLQTGNTTQNHNVITTTIKPYYDAARRGQSNPYVWGVNPDRCFGPWEFDLAHKVGVYLLSLNPTDPLGLDLVAGNQVSSADLIAHPALTVGGFASARRKGWNNTLGIFDGTGTTDGSPVQLIDANDDFQGNTGGMFSIMGRSDWLDFVGAFGKLHNGSGQIDSSSPFNAFDSTGAITLAKTSRFVPPGLSHCCIYGDDVQDHFRYRTTEYTGTLDTNPGWGNGAVGDICWYNALLRISSITWAAGTATVVLANEPGYWRNGTFVAWHLVPGDEFGVRKVTVAGSHDNAYNLATATVVTSSVDGKTITYATTDPGASPGTLASPTGAYSHIAPRKMFSEHLIQLRLSQALANANVDATTRGILFWGSRSPHEPLLDFNTDTTPPWPDTTSAFADNDLNVEPRYRDPRKLAATDQGLQVDLSGAYFWEGVSGAVSPAVTTAQTSGEKRTWAERGCMHASFNDAYTVFYDDLSARRGVTGAGDNAWSDLFFGDNGWQQDEDYGVESGTSNPVGGKAFNREGSQRLMAVIRRPGETPGDDTDRHLTPADILPTLLDWHGKTAHHVHQTRDGISRERDDNNRALPGWGKYNGSAVITTGQSIMRKDLLCLRRITATPTTYRVENYAISGSSIIGASADWGTTDVKASLTGAQQTEFKAQCTAVSLAGWNAVTLHNSLHDAVVMTP